MRQMGIRAQWSKPWTITTKDSDFSTELQNILDEQFNPDRPNAVWCSDITYIWTIDGFVYLTSVMDLFSRKIIAWTLSETLEVSCVIDTINKAKARRNMINHSLSIRIVAANMLQQARIKSTNLDYLNKLTKLDLLVIDDFGLMDLDLDKCRALFEVLDTRDGRKSTVVISQFPVSTWFDMFADNTYADACLIRITDKHHTYRLEMNGINMRETE